MRRGTTPTHIFRTDINLDNISVIYITYQQKGRTVLEKALEDVSFEDENTFSIVLSQEDTLAFKSPDLVEIQIRLKYADGSALASGIIRTNAEQILKDGEI